MQSLLNNANSVYYRMFFVHSTLNQHIQEINDASSNPIQSAKACQRYLDTLYSWRRTMYAYTAYMIDLNGLILNAEIYSSRVLNLPHITDSAITLQRAFRRHQYNKSEKNPITHQELMEAFPSTRLTLTPPEVIEGNSIDKAAAKRWIAANSGHLQHLAQRVVDHTKCVSFQKLKKGIEKAVLEFNRQLMQLPVEQRDYILLIGEGGATDKSNSWVTSIALRYLAKLPKEIIPIRRGSSSEQQEVVRNSLQKHPGIKTLIYFDDAIYSAMQISETFNSAILSLKLDGYTLYVGAPFIRHAKPAYERLNNLMGSVNTANKVILLPYTPMLLLRDLLNNEDQKYFDELVVSERYNMSMNGLATKSLIFFEHKVPDVISISSSLIRGAVIDCYTTGNDACIPFINQTLSPYKR